MGPQDISSKPEKITLFTQLLLSSTERMVMSKKVMKYHPHGSVFFITSSMEKRGGNLVGQDDYLIYYRK
jgi:hypothetical protein